MSANPPTDVTDWMEEETAFARQRREPGLSIVEKKWSAGSSPIMLVKLGHENLTEWEECFWYEYPSKARCTGCPHAGVCDHLKYDRAKQEVIG